MEEDEDRWYFSPMDWRRSGFSARSATPAFLVYAERSEELLSNYGASMCSGSTGTAVSDVRSAQTYAIVRLQRDHSNHRLDLGIATTTTKSSAPTPIYTPEQRVGQYDDQAPPGKPA